MNDELENQLRRTLRPVDAPEGFAERLMQRLPQAQSNGKAPVLVALAPRASKPSRNFAVPTALAASLVAAVFLGQQMSQNRLAQEEAAGRAASQEILQALRVTSEKLDMAYEAVNSPDSPAESRADEQENPS